MDDLGNIFRGLDAGPIVSGVHQVGDDNIGAVEDRAARLPQVNAPGSRNQRIEFAANPVDLAVTDDFAPGSFLIPAAVDYGDIGCPS
jgi:hypothetical protein